jgi:hypothetical protein
MEDNTSNNGAKHPNPSGSLTAVQPPAPPRRVRIYLTGAERGSNDVDVFQAASQRWDFEINVGLDLLPTAPGSR